MEKRGMKNMDTSLSTLKNIPGNNYNMILIPHFLRKEKRDGSNPKR
jgi:hypothetical protein